MVSAMKRKPRKIGVVLVATILASGCATHETFDDVQASELHSGTLTPGDQLTIAYHDGTEVEFVVSEILDDHLVADSGEQWPKEGISSLTIRVEPDSSDCGSLASWKNGQCWKDDAKRELCVQTNGNLCF